MFYFNVRYILTLTACIGLKQCENISSHYTNLTYAEAKNFCKLQNLILPLPNTPHIEEGMHYGITSFWIDTQKRVNNTWKLVGSSDYYTGPILDKKRGNCVALQKTNLNAVNCFAKNHFICQYSDCKACKSEKCHSQGNGSCLVLNESPLNWFHAKQHCNSISAVLATLTTVNDIPKHLRQKCDPQNQCELWTAIHREEWINNKYGTIVQKYNWIENTKVTDSNRENCVIVMKSSMYKWKPVACSSRQNTLCVFDTDSINTDTDSVTESIRKDELVPAHEGNIHISLVGFSVLTVLVLGLILLIILLLVKVRQRHNRQEMDTATVNNYELYDRACTSRTNARQEHLNQSTEENTELLHLYDVIGNELEAEVRIDREKKGVLQKMSWRSEQLISSSNYIENTTKYSATI